MVWNIVLNLKLMDWLDYADIQLKIIWRHTNKQHVAYNAHHEIQIKIEHLNVFVKLLLCDRYIIRDIID